MKKLLAILILGLFCVNAGFADEIDYEKTILENRIVGIFSRDGKDTSRHEWIFKNEGAVLRDVYLIPSTELLGHYRGCWSPTKNYRILAEIPDCLTNEITGTYTFDFVNMILKIDTVYDEHLIYKLIEPIKIIYK